jgi:hypothetical protein
MGTNLLRDLLRQRGYWFDKATGDYVSRWNGRHVSQKYVLAHLERYEAAVKSNLDKMTDRFIAGRMTLPDWQRAVAGELRDAWRINTILGKGGYANMTQADWGRMGARLREEYRALNKFAMDIKDGKLSDAQVRYRVSQYAKGPLVAYRDGQEAAKKDASYDLSRRYLGPAEHCEDCIEYAAMGWRPIGELPPPGVGSRCGHSCMCSEEFGKSAEVFTLPEATV